jgi:hypothetical protein
MRDTPPKKKSIGWNLKSKDEIEGWHRTCLGSDLDPEMC